MTVLTESDKFAYSRGWTWDIVRESFRLQKLAKFYSSVQLGFTWLRNLSVAEIDRTKEDVLTAGKI